MASTTQTGKYTEECIKKMIKDILKVEVIPWKDYDEEKIPCVVSQMPFIDYFGNKGRMDFTLLMHTKTIHMEVKTQNVGGSVDQKLPYVFLNLSHLQNETTESIFVYCGKEFQKKRIKGIMRKMENITKKVKVIDMENELRTCLEYLYKNMEKHIQSPLKWVGGKRQQVYKIVEKIPEKVHTFYEPFGGSLSVSLYVMQNTKIKNYVIGDVNEKLINFWKQIEESCEEVIKELNKCIETYINKKAYYDLRNEFNGECEATRNAALFIFMNKTCFNGVYRVNKKGEFNVPIGRNKPTWENIIKQLREVSELMKTKNINISKMDYKEFFKRNTIKKRDCIYVDPPYYDTFNQYDGCVFTKDDQINLRDILMKQKCSVIASNSNTEYVRELYKGWDIEEINASRSINSNIKLRKAKNVEVMMTLFQ